MDDREQPSGVQAEILMGHHVAQAGEPFPVDVRMTGNDVRRQGFHGLPQLGERVLQRPEAHPVGIRDLVERGRVHCPCEIAQVGGCVPDILQTLLQAPWHQNAWTMSRSAETATLEAIVERSPRSTGRPRTASASSLM